MRWTRLSQNKEWMETCERFCRECGLELLRVRSSYIEVALRDGTVKRLRPVEMAAMAGERLVASCVFG